MSEPVIERVPWKCRSSSCTSPECWHAETFWVDSESSTGYTVDAFSDGDHEECEESDLPTATAVAARRKQYLQWVAHEGEDPLGEVRVATTRPVPWTVKLRVGIGGMVLHSARQKGKRALLAYKRNVIPEPVLVWFDLEQSPTGICRSREQSCKAYQGYMQESEARGELRVTRRGGWFYCTRKIQTLRSAREIRNDVRKGAKAQLSRED